MVKSCYGYLRSLSFWPHAYDQTPSQPLVHTYQPCPPSLKPHWLIVLCGHQANMAHSFHC